MDAGGAAGGVVVRFGVFDLDLRTAELRKGGQAVIEDLGSRNGALHLTFRAPEARASAETV